MLIPVVAPCSRNDHGVGVGGQKLTSLGAIALGLCQQFLPLHFRPAGFELPDQVFRWQRGARRCEQVVWVWVWVVLLVVWMGIVAPPLTVYRVTGTISGLAVRMKTVEASAGAAATTVAAAASTPPRRRTKVTEIRHERSVRMVVADVDWSPKRWVAATSYQSRALAATFAAIASLLAAFVVVAAA